MYPRTAFKKTLGFALLAPALLGACGNITLGGGTQNDPTPTGTIVAQGPFTGLNGRTVTGNVSVYQQVGTSGACTFVVQLQSLNAPNDAGVTLEVIPVVNGAPNLVPSEYALRSPTGNENYSFTASQCSVNCAQVAIANPAATPASSQDYAIANLTPL